MVNYYDELEIEDFAWDPIAKVFHHPCPCGDRFEISKSQLCDGEQIATCPSCSLIVRVIYDYLDWEDYAMTDEEDGDGAGDVESDDEDDQRGGQSAQEVQLIKTADELASKMETSLKVSPGGSRGKIRVLDGGMGTTLESLGHDVSSPLWGCDLLQSCPEAITDIHARWLVSGADIIGTATYQLTRNGLCNYAKIASGPAEKIMHRGITLAADAIGSHSSTQLRGVALSLGPYGAILSPSQEYSGIYPPPYGPSSSTTNLHTSAKEEEEAITALAQFHLQRLQSYAKDVKAWNAIEWIAFETIPLITEIKAVRRAIKELSNGGGGRGGDRKKFWITCPFPEGKHPQRTSKQEEHASIEEVLCAMIGSNDDEGGDDVPPADGVGLNCTIPKFIDSLSEQFTTALRDYQNDLKQDGRSTTFVLYPNGGRVYDTVLRTWSDGQYSVNEWAPLVAQTAKSVSEARLGGEKGEGENGRQRVWEGVIVGGCCKTSFDEIAALRKALDR